ncbi:MAG: phosphoribosyltransferase family protein [Nitrospiraceae bacterium]|nr:phosphoribosyltransferase family protein [Nitrospiraceae bacterium]
MGAFRDREAAARELLPALSPWRASRPLVLAIPRGAVPMGEILARELSGDLDVVLARKIGAPGDPEFAIGAVDENGTLLLNPEARLIGVGPGEAEEERQRELLVIRERRRLWGKGRPPVDPSGRTVIIVDDGMATGSTMAAALQFLREKNPAILVAAVPVASREALDRIRPLADRIICLWAPEDFSSVSQFYDSFPQVGDEEVRLILEKRPVRASGQPPG